MIATIVLEKSMKSTIFFQIIKETRGMCKYLILTLNLLIIALFPAHLSAVSVLEPPFKFQDSNQDGINELFRDADGDGVDDISGIPYQHNYEWKDSNNDGKNDFFQDADGNGENDLSRGIDSNSIVALDYDQDGKNDVTQKQIVAKRNTFIDTDKDGIDDRHSVLRRGGGNRGRGGGRGSGRGSGFSSGVNVTSYPSSPGFQKRESRAFWDKGSYYMKKKFRSNQQKVTGSVLDIKKWSPFPEMPIGVTLFLKDQLGTEVEIDLGPEWFITRKGIRVDVGDNLTIEGYETSLDDRNFVIAYRLILNEEVIEIRDRKGKLQF